MTRRAATKPNGERPGAGRRPAAGPRSPRARDGRRRRVDRRGRRGAARPGAAPRRIHDNPPLIQAARCQTLGAAAAAQAQAAAPAAVPRPRAARHPLRAALEVVRRPDRDTVLTGARPRAHRHWCGLTSGALHIVRRTRGESPVRLGAGLSASLAWQGTHGLAVRLVCRRCTTVWRPPTSEPDCELHQDGPGPHSTYALSVEVLLPPPVYVAFTCHAFG
jgi:hypothetical protein